MPAELQRRYGVFLGQNLPAPLVELEIALREAKNRRNKPAMQAEKQAIPAATIAPVQAALAVPLLCFP